MPATPVVVVDTEVPFMSVVKLFVRTAIALALSAIIVAVFWLLIAGVMDGLCSGLSGGS